MAGTVFYVTDDYFRVLGVRPVVGSGLPPGTGALASYDAPGRWRRPRGAARAARAARRGAATPQNTLLDVVRAAVR